VCAMVHMDHPTIDGNKCDLEIKRISEKEKKKEDAECG
jgi:hypothetical protein